MTRCFSIIRRRPNIIDLITPVVLGVDTYRLSWGSNFDVTPVDFLDTPNTGYLDPKFFDTPQTVTPGNNVRMVFDPATFSIPDTSPIWLQLSHVVGGAAKVKSGRTLVLPRYNETSVLGLAGTAASAADLSGSIQIDFPRLVTDLRVHNQHATAALLLAFDAGGPEITVGAAPTMQTISLTGTQGSLFVRGDGADVPFSATCTFAFVR